MRRALAAAAALAWAVALGGGPVGGQEEPQKLFRASATATAVHGFYDHEDLFPVPILNLSVPHTEASVSPGPSSESRGSFLWDPEVADLGTILCVLSEGGFCQFPDYPFVARASHPSAGGEEDPPTVSIDERGAPVLVRAAHEDAEATARGASADASAARLRAVPMSLAQAAAARGLASILDPLSAAEEPTPWLIEVAGAASTSAARTTADDVTATATSELTGLRLLGGLITAEAVSGESRSVVGEGRRGRAETTVTRLRVGDLRAEIGPQGIRIDDRRLGAEELATVNEALNQALGEAGFAIGPGRERVRRSDGSVESVAYAFSLEFRRRVAPEQFPEGTRGADVVRIPMGLATTEAALAQILPPAVELPPPAAAPGGGGVAGTGGTVGGQGGVPPGGSPSVDVAEGAPPGDAVATQPLAGITDLGVPLVAVVVAALAALAIAAGLTWLKVNEVLSE